MSPDPCPGLEDLDQLLNEQLEADQEARLVAHIQTCKSCQERLERLTAGRDQARNNRTTQEASQKGGQTPGLFSTTDPGATTDFVPAAFVLVTNKAGDSCPEEMADRTADFPPRAANRTVSRNGSQPVEPKMRPEGDTHPSPARPEIPGYELLEKLGEGGMGVVFLARQLGLNRLVAVKMIRGGSHARPDHFSRFRVEAEAVALLRHPNIIQIYEIGEIDGLPFVSLELLQGGSLDDRLGGTPQPGRQAAELMITLTGAVGVAHDAGIVHRDLKPTNVLFTADGTPKITDFGLAKRLDSDSKQTESGQVMGSPSYMAPEQARGHTKEVGRSADVYALGAILYELLTGRPPFKGETPMETVRQVIDDDPVPPSRLVPRVARDLETICLKCLSKEAPKRYESARALAEDLTRYLRGEPIKARPTPAWERAAKWARRRPLAASACVLGIALAFGLTTGGFAYERSLRLAEQKRGDMLQVLQDRGLSLLEPADAAKSQAELEDIQVKLSEFLQEIKSEPKLQLLSVRLADKRSEVSGRLAALQSRQKESERLQADRERLQKFRTLGNQAQLYTAHLGVLDPAEYARSMRQAALAALAVYALDPQAPATAWRLAHPLPDALGQEEKMEIAGACYDLLLMLSETVDPAEGLQVLARAAELRPEPSAAYHFRRAACLARAGDAAGGAREEQAAQAIKPTTALDHLLIGREQLGRRQDRDAIRSLNAAIRLDPNQLGAHLLLAVAFFNSQSYSEAKSSLNTCIRTAPDLLGLYLFRALVYGEEGNRALLRIKEAPEQAARLRLDAADAFTAAEDDYHRALELNPGPDFRYVLLVNRAGMYLQAGRLDQAAADLEAGIKLKPGPYQAHALLAQVCQQQGRLDQAAEELNRAIERQPDRPELFRARAWLVARPAEKGAERSPEPAPAERAAAIRDLEQAIRLEPKDLPQTADDHAERGRLLFASGQTAEALAAYDATLKIVPHDLKALRLRTLALLEQERYDDVLQACNGFLEQGKPSADLLEIRGQARLARKDFAGAISDYTVALSLTPDSPALHNHRGWAYLFADAFKLALTDFDAAIRFDPGLGHAYSGRGLARVSLGNWRDAVADVETAVRLASGPQKQREYFNAARVHALALKFAAEEVSRHGEAGLSLYRRLRDRAGALLLQSARLLPPDKQAPFWRDVVASDPVLRPFIP
jgi:tetratricopeptide (TPR) repeat protein